MSLIPSPPPQRGGSVLSGASSVGSVVRWAVSASEPPFFSFPRSACDAQCKKRGRILGNADLTLRVSNRTGTERSGVHGKGLSIKLVRIFTLRFNRVPGRFDDEELRDFLKDKEVLSIRDHFFVKDVRTSRRFGTCGRLTLVETEPLIALIVADKTDPVPSVPVGWISVNSGSGVKSPNSPDRG